ncbi:hypothetical protein ZIOFF_065055 [Zingiber officinale]|uniref:Uncharacterized protein n=1 Tax=Zingiber officinale TaxID=94328 RepID=A0A8J5EWN8_ZINOF|nr:hypothetical protein ZIOFF_065055 [Zingiber officinale]
MKRGDTTPHPRRGPGRPRKPPIESVEAEPVEYEADSVRDPTEVEIDSRAQTPQVPMRDPGFQPQWVPPTLPPVAPTPAATSWTKDRDRIPLLARSVKDHITLFYGVPDPSVARSWLGNVEDTFEYLSLTAQSSASLSNSSIVYDILQEYNLPPGILPDTVKSFSVASNGYFVIDLYGECYVDFKYVIYYGPRVSGFLGYVSVSNLEGVQIRSYLIWYGVSYIKVGLPYSDFVYIQFGWVTRKIDID